MIRSSLPHLHIAALSHAGMSGKNNEDRYAVSSFQLSKDDSRPSLFAVVADGIGGHRAGEVAAELAVNYITAVVAAPFTMSRDMRSRCPETRHLRAHVEKCWSDPYSVARIGVSTLQTYTSACIRG